jgi:signal transduction histidine kinase
MSTSLAVLAEILASLASSSPLDGALRQVVEMLCEALACDAAGIWLGDQPLELVAEHGNPPRDASVIASVAHGHAPQVVDRPLGIGNEEFSAYVGIPLLWQGECGGVLLAAHRRAGQAFTDSEIKLLELVAQQVSATVAADRRSQRALQDAQSLDTERERLLHVQVAIRRMLEEPELAANMREVSEALQALGWRRIAVALFDESGQVVQLLTSGIAPEEEPAYHESVIPHDIWTRFLAEDLDQHRLSGVYFIPAGDPAASGWDPCDLVFAPLQIGQEMVVGVIRVEEPVDNLRPDRTALRPLDILAAQAAYIVENAYLLDRASQSAETLADQVEELSMMHRADRELSSNLDIDRIMRLTMDWALRRTGAETGLLMLITDDKRGLVPLVTIGYSDRSRFPYNEQNPLPLEKGVVGRAVRLRQTQLVRDVTIDKDYLSITPTAKTMVAVPLSMRGEVLGVIALTSSRPQTFDEQNVGFLERLSRRSAVALDNARLFRQSEQMADDMAMLYTASQVITSTLERNEVLQRIAQALTMALEGSSAIICDYQRETQQAQVLAAYRLGTLQNAQEVLPPVGYAIAISTYPAFQTAIEQQHPLVLRASDPTIMPLDRQHLDQDHIHAMVLIPLIAQNELIGISAVIEGRRDRIFTANDVFKAETLASQASVALRQSRLFSEVRELEKLKSEMIRMASHDLRNPLNNVMGYVELVAMTLDQDGMTPDLEMYIDNLRRGTQAMRQLLEDLLTLERIESDRQSDWQLFDLGGLVMEVVEAQQSSADLKQQALVLNRMLRTPFVRGSLTQIRQAIANLVGNAIKYTPEEGRVEVSFQVEGDRLSLSVRDNGYGISPERQNRVFERFYRAREPGTDHIGGTGLGLSLVKTVIERHGGQVWFTSAPGVGSTFGFWLPVAHMEPGQVPPSV